MRSVWRPCTRTNFVPSYVTLPIASMLTEYTGHSPRHSVLSSLRTKSSGTRCAAVGAGVVASPTATRRHHNRHRRFHFCPSAPTTSPTRGRLISICFTVLTPARRVWLSRHLSENRDLSERLPLRRPTPQLQVPLVASPRNT